MLTITDPKQFNDLLSIQKATKMLQISRSTLYQWVKDGYVKPIKIGSKNLFHWPTLLNEVTGIADKKLKEREDMAAKLAKKETKRRMASRLVRGML